MVRDLEVRVTAVSNATAQPQTCTQATPPAPLTVMDVMSMPDVSKMQIDLLVLALTCDLTRIATLMYSDAKDHIALPFINIESDVHNITHLSDADPTRAQLATRDQWRSQQMAYLLGQLQAVPSGQGTLLDQTLVFWGSEISVGNTHSHASMPFMFAGGGAGWRMGRNLSFAHQPHNTLLLTILQSFGGTEQSFRRCRLQRRNVERLFLKGGEMPQTLVSSDRSLAVTEHAGVQLVLHARNSSTDAWNEMIGGLGPFIANGGRAVLVKVQPGAAPSVKQRSALNEHLKGHPVRVAVLTGSSIARAAGIAISWLNPLLKMFAPDDLAAALLHLQRDPAELGEFAARLTALESALHNEPLARP